MNHSPSISQNCLQQAFEQLAYSLWAVFYQYQVPDDVIWESSRYVHKAFLQITQELHHQNESEEESELHPAVRELIRQIKKPQ